MEEKEVERVKDDENEENGRRWNVDPFGKMHWEKHEETLKDMSSEMMMYIIIRSTTWTAINQLCEASIVIIENSDHQPQLAFFDIIVHSYSYGPTPLPIGENSTADYSHRIDLR